jgi:hypothetical protein
MGKIYMLNKIILLNNLIRHPLTYRVHISTENESK